VLKVEQDAWINLPQLITALRDAPLRLPVGLAGYCTTTTVQLLRFPNEAMARHMSPAVLRNININGDRMLEDKDVWPPPRCHESGYVTSPLAAQDIVRVSEEVPFSTTIESLYLGLCLSRLHLSVDTLPGFSMRPQDSYWIKDLCELHEDRIVLRRGFTPQELRFIWAEGKCTPRQKLKRKSRPLLIGVPVD
jgi:hypothetical protein